MQELARHNSLSVVVKSSTNIILDLLGMSSRVLRLFSFWSIMFKSCPRRDGVVLYLRADDVSFRGSIRFCAVNSLVLDLVLSVSRVCSARVIPEIASRAWARVNLAPQQHGYIWTLRHVINQERALTLPTSIGRYILNIYRKLRHPLAGYLGATMAAQKRVLGDSTNTRQNATVSPISAKKRKLNGPPSPVKTFKSSQNDHKVRIGSSQPKSQFEETLEKLTQDMTDLKENNSEKDQQWARPGMEDFDETVENLVFQQIEAEEGTVRGGETAIKLFGVTEVTTASSLLFH